jgi:myo-inositol catabolism protein IolC
MRAASIRTVTDRLYILAFDHRRSLMTSFFDVRGEPSEADIERARTAKAVIWEGLLAAIDAPDVGRAAAALVDATYGRDVIREAHEHDVRIAVPVEASGRDELAWEHDDWKARLAELDPTWAKVLVRYHPDGDADANERQRAKLRELAEHCRDTGRACMIELLVPPLPSQAGPSYDDDLRPDLMVRAIDELREDGANVDVWKIEGVRDVDQGRRVLWAAGAPCVVLGRGADRSAIDRWLTVAASAGFAGFAIGRSIWWDALKAYFARESDRADAVRHIAAEYRRCVELYASVAAHGPPADP